MQTNWNIVGVLGGSIAATAVAADAFYADQGPTTAGFVVLVAVLASVLGAVVYGLCRSIGWGIAGVSRPSSG